MDTDKNIHEGHRKRLTDKVLKYSEMFSEHELLEVLLFYAIPRKDTNALAHVLIRTLGSIENVFSAPLETLMGVEGVGEKTAILILTIGEIMKRINSTPKKKEVLSTPEKLYDVIMKEFKGLLKERCVLFMLDKKFKLLGKLTYGDEKEFSVSMDVNEMIGSFVALKPTFVIFAHNHLSDNCSPSKVDEITTKKLNVICSLHGVNLVDHVITNGTKKYSFRDSGLMAHIKENADINKVLNSGGLL